MQPLPPIFLQSGRTTESSEFSGRKEHARERKSATASHLSVTIEEEDISWQSLQLLLLFLVVMPTAVAATTWRAPSISKVDGLSDRDPEGGGPLSS